MTTETAARSERDISAQANSISVRARDYAEHECATTLVHADRMWRMCTTDRNSSLERLLIN